MSDLNALRRRSNCLTWPVVISSPCTRKVLAGVLSGCLVLGWGWWPGLADLLDEPGDVVAGFRPVPVSVALTSDPRLDVNRNLNRSRCYGGVAGRLRTVIEASQGTNDRTLTDNFASVYGAVESARRLLLKSGTTHPAAPVMCIMAPKQAKNSC